MFHTNSSHTHSSYRKLWCGLFVLSGFLAGVVVSAAASSRVMPMNQASKQPPAQEPGAIQVSEIYVATLDALDGDPRAAEKLALMEYQGDPVPAVYRAMISAQNGNDGLLGLAGSLYWSANSFNKVRAIFWCKDSRSDLIGDRFWGGRLGKNGLPLQPENQKRWQEILNKDVQEKMVGKAIQDLKLSEDEQHILLKNGREALMGSKDSARTLWKFYGTKCLGEDSEEGRIRLDWIAWCNLSLQGFPGPRIIDKYFYWMLIAAENGDTESQWMVANYHDISQYPSRLRHRFWLKKAREGGWQKASTQFEQEKQIAGFYH